MQRASFSDGLYFNAGPARIPSWHHAILGYAKRFNVPMETFVNSHVATGWDFGGKVHPGRQVLYSFQARMSELLAKAIDVHALDAVMPKDELGHFREFLQFYGGLDAKGVPVGQPSLGFSDWPGAGDDPGKPLDVLPLKDILPNRGAAFPLFFESIIDMQPTMLQPVGGMDRIAHAIYEQVKPSVRLNQPVSAIRREGGRVRIEHKGGVTRADYAVVTLPANLLSRIPSDFSAEQEGRAAESGLSEERQGGVRSAALLGRGRHLRRARLDRSVERERHLSERPAPFGARCAGRRLCRRLDPPGHAR